MGTLHTYLAIQAIALVVAAAGMIYESYKHDELTAWEALAFCGLAAFLILFITMFFYLVGFEIVLYHQRLLNNH